VKNSILLIPVLIITALIIVSSLKAQHVNPQWEVRCKHQHHYSPQFSFEIYERPEWYDDYDVSFYFLDIVVQNNTTFVEGNATTIATVKSPVIDVFNFELIDQLTIDSVIVNGVNSTFVHTNDLVTVELESPVSSGETITATTFYSGEPPSTGFFSSQGITM